MKTAVTQIFDDLDQLKKFCVHFGYRFNEADLYNMRSYVYKAYLRFKEGKRVTNQWARDARNFRR